MMRITTITLVTPYIAKEAIASIFAVGFLDFKYAIPPSQMQHKHTHPKMKIISAGIRSSSPGGRLTVTTVV